MRSTSKGFSLIELMVAVTIMGIMVGLVVPAYMAYRQRARRSATVTTLKTLENAIDMFQGDTGAYPATLPELVNAPTDPKISKRWQGPYLKKEVTTDSYGHELVYQVTKGGKRPYELYSWGPKGEGAPQEEHIVVWDI